MSARTPPAPASSCSSAPSCNRLIGQTERAGYTLVPTAMYWKRGRAKLEIGLAKGKKLHDKRASEKDKDWQREKERLFKSG